MNTAFTQPELMQNNEGQVLRLETLINIRWLAVIGQTIAVLFVHFFMGFDLLLLPCLFVIGASVWLNTFLRFRYPGNVRWRGKAVTALLAYDLAQLTVLLYMTGGLQNPFSILIAVPVIVSATSQKTKNIIPLFILALLSASLLVFYYQPLPWFTEPAIEFPLKLRIGIWVAIASTMAFTAVYTYRVADESRKLADALAATEFVLQREQHMTNLDGLATAAAHELGTPLATISLVSKEMLHTIPADNPLYEDTVLLKSQADRCREILKKISSLSSQEDENIARLSVDVLMAEVSAPHKDYGTNIILSESGTGPVPKIRRNSAILYGLGNLLENAADFSNSTVKFSVSWDAEEVTFLIQDDGEGFEQTILDQIGEPFISNRKKLRKETGGGLGLGLFIAKTLLERNGATLVFSNYRNQNSSGAQVSISWKRQVFENNS